MVKNKCSLFEIIEIIIGAYGLRLGAFSVVTFQMIERPQGPPGQDGQDGIDGEDAPGNIVVGILDPDHREVMSGNVIIRAPMEWDTIIESDEWYNISIIATDIASKNKSQNDVIVYIKNTDTTDPHAITQPMGRIIADAPVYQMGEYKIERKVNSESVSHENSFKNFIFIVKSIYFLKND